MPDVQDLLREAVGGFQPRADQRSIEDRVERRRRRREARGAVVAVGVFVVAGVLAWIAFRPNESINGSSGPSRSATVLVPDVVGLPPAEARATLVDAGLEVSVTLVPSDEFAAGVVAEQRPRPGLAVGTGSSVTIAVSRGPAPTEPIPIGELPDRGVAVASGGAVQLVALDGRTLATLPGYTLAGTPGAPGVWLQRGADVFSLSVEDGALIPVPPDVAHDVVNDEGAEPELPPPASGGSSPVPAQGHWRYAIDSGAGITLGQWSGECEVPVAFWIGPGEGPLIVTGEGDLSAAPQSLALGWSPAGEAIVLVSTGPCGSSAVLPGIFLYSAPGDGRLLHATEGSSVLADAWGTGL